MKVPEPHWIYRAFFNSSIMNEGFYRKKVRENFKEKINDLINERERFWISRIQKLCISENLVPKQVTKELLIYQTIDVFFSEAFSIRIMSAAETIQKRKGNHLRMKQCAWMHLNGITRDDIRIDHEFITEYNFMLLVLNKLQITNEL